MEAKIVKVNGALKIDIDGEIFEPISFKSFRPTIENISDFRRAGVRLFSMLSSGINCSPDIPYSLFGESWVGVGEYDFDVIDRQIDLFIQAAPDGYFMLCGNPTEWLSGLFDCAEYKSENCTVTLPKTDFASKLLIYE